MITLAVYLVAPWPPPSPGRVVPVPDALHRRHGHRRRVLGDQLGHRRADPGARARLGRHFFLDPSIFPIDLGWRLTFGLGAILGIGVLLTRRLLPESPRWLMIKGEKEEAERVVCEIERKVSDETGERLDDVDETIEIEPRATTAFITIARTMFKEYTSRAVLGLTMMSAQRSPTTRSSSPTASS
jgi:sugar transport protein